MSTPLTKMETASVQSIISGLLTLATSDGGQALLVKLFGDASITPAVVHNLVAKLPEVKPPKEA